MRFWEVQKDNSSFKKFLPELYTQAVFRKFSGFCKRLESISRDFKFKILLLLICEREEPRTGNPMDFTPEEEDKVTREAVSHKLEKPLVNISNKVWRDSNQTKSPNSPFHIGDSLRYTNKVHNEMVDLVDINTNYPDSIK